MIKGREGRVKRRTSPSGASAAPILLWSFALLFSLLVGPALVGGEDGTLVFMARRNPETLDPHLAFSWESLRIIRNTYETLVRERAGTTVLEPLLAESWELSDGGVTYLLRLRENVSFQDGTPLDAYAAAYSLERARALGGMSAGLLGGVKEVEARDARTLRIRLASPDAYFLAVLARIPILSPAAVKAHDLEGDLASRWLESHSAGTGPYRLGRVGQRDVVLERYEGYWRGWDGRHLGTVVISKVDDALTLRRYLETGRAHMAVDLSPDDIEILSQTDGLTIVSHPALEVDAITLHTRRKPLSDPRVRRAMALLFPYEQMLSVGLGGRGLLPRGPLHEGWPEFDSRLPPMRQDLGEARRLLAEAGYPKGGFSLRYAYAPYRKADQVAGRLLKEAAKQLGIDVELVALPWSSLVEAMRSPAEAPDMAMVHVTPFLPEPLQLLELVYHSASISTVYNWSFYKNAEVDALLETARRTIDPVKRAELLRRCQGVILRDAPTILVAAPFHVEAMSARIRGYVPDLTDGGSIPRFYDLYLE